MIHRCAARQGYAPNADPELLRVQEVLLTLEKRGVEVQRFNLSRQLAKFMLNPTIARLMKEQGRAVLPITMVGDQVIKTGSYQCRLCR